MGEWDQAMTYHQMDYDLSERHEDMTGKVKLELESFQPTKFWFINIL